MMIFGQKMYEVAISKIGHSSLTIGPETNTASKATLPYTITQPVFVRVHAIREQVVTLREFDMSQPGFYIYFTEST